MFNIIYCKKNQPVLNQPISSRSKEKTNVLVCATCMCNMYVQCSGIFTLLCGASICFMKALKAFIKPFEAPQRSAKIKI